ncbi:MAG: TrkH family potassium uptake protein [Clostridia bacterium]|nr:TrkH family potassium uptake protein [Clostridia bacterium]
MNRRMVLNILGRMLIAEAALLALPMAVSVYYLEKCFFAFLITALFSLFTGLLLRLVSKPRKTTIYAKEGFIIVALVWIVMSLVGALPFTISREIPNYFDAIFETVSGFTTTGASVVKDVEKLSRGILFWRSFTHWIGGMGILLFVMAIIPNLSDRTVHIMRAEVPGPVVDKIVPRLKQTAKILYSIYIVITAIEVVLLLCGGMTFYESLLHSFGTAGTGGFGIKRESIAYYSPYCQWVIGIFMLIFGVNFNIYYLIIAKRIKGVLKSKELLWYLSIFFISFVLISFNVSFLYNNFSETVRNSFFQVSSIMTTTGYSTVDFDKWPLFSRGLLLVIMMIGGCSGSTAGGLKVSRVALLIKQVGREIKHMLHPKSVSVVRFDSKPVDEDTLKNVSVYFILYIICIMAVFMLLCLEPPPFNTETNLSATLACINNIGPGLDIVGPAGNYAAYSSFSKVVLSVAMLLGRLEIFPLLLLFTPAMWKKH